MVVIIGTESSLQPFLWHPLDILSDIILNITLYCNWVLTKGEWNKW